MVDTIVGEHSRADYLMTHLLDDPYWQSDSIFYDSVNIEAAAYLAGKSSIEVSVATFTKLLRRSYANVDHYSNLAFYLDILLGNPSSKFRNDSLFEMLLDSIIASPLEDTFKLIPRQRLGALQKNKLGSKAADLKMISYNKKTKRLSEYKGISILLVLASSECEDCRDFLFDLNSDKAITNFIDNGQLKVVVLFVDNAFPDYSDGLEKLDLFRDGQKSVLEDEVYIARVLPSYYLINEQMIVEGRELTPTISKKFFYH